MPTGSVIQTKHLIINTTTAATNSTFITMNGSNLAITPISTSNNILIQYNYHIYIANGTSNTWKGGNVRLLNVTANSVLQTDGTYGEIMYAIDGGDRSMGFANGAFLHSPSTTSEITYGLECNSHKSGDTITYNNPSYARGGYITLQEIAG